METRTKLAGLDVIRFIAAFMVMIFHLAFWSWWWDVLRDNPIRSDNPRFPELIDLSWSGWVGVPIFFVISGFVISYSAGNSPFGFFRSRALRLFPVAWICATLSFLVLETFGSDAPHGIAEYARSMTLWGYGPWIDGAYWTLPIEIVFYFVVLAVLMISQRSRLVAVIGALGLLSSIYWIARGVAKYSGLRLDQIDQTSMNLTLIPHGCYFAIGGLLYFLLMENNRIWWIKPAIAISIVGGILEIASVAKGKAVLMGNMALVVVPILIWLLSVICVILSVRFNDRISLFINPGKARTIGIMTYPLYLLHSTVGIVAMKSIFGLWGGRWAALAGGILVSLFASWLVSRAAEPPIRRALAAILDAARASTSTARVSP